MVRPHVRSKLLELAQTPSLTESAETEPPVAEPGGGEMLEPEFNIMILSRLSRCHTNWQEADPGALTCQNKP
jgi:hypothetical protein